MDPLSVTASIIAILQLTTEIVKYLNDVKDAPKDRAQFAIEATNLSGLLISLKYRLEEGRSNEAWYKEVNLLGVRCGPLEQYKDALEKLQHKVLDKKGLAKMGSALIWKFSKEEVTSILSIIERLKSLIHIALQMDHFKLSQEIKRYIDDIQRNSQATRTDVSFVRNQIPILQDGVYGLQVGVDKLQLGVNEFQQDQDRQKHHMLMEWISSTNFPAQQSDLIGRRQEGTAQWFLNSPKFIQWIDGRNETLFCPGIPGAGKTMMAAVTIDYLSTTTESDLIGIAYVFCNYKAQADQTAASLLAAILKQLMQTRPSVAEPVSRLYEHHSSRRTQPSLEELYNALWTVVKSLMTVYIVVDALDECSDQDGTRSQLLARLRDLQRGADVHLIFTSRYIIDVEEEFKLLPKLEIRASSADVKQFVKGQIHRLPGCIQRDTELQSRVEDKVVQAVDGMFLLARLHVDSLLDKRTKSKVCSMLEKLRKGSESLDKAYDEALKRVDAQLPEDSKLAKRALSWITYAQRPLTTDELRYALAVEPGEEKFDEENVLDVEDIVSVCAGLVTVDEDSNIIRLVHYTTQEYFERIRESWNPTAQLENTSTCLTYLSFHCFRSGSCPNVEDFESRLEENAFLDYASRYWGEHARTVQEKVYDLASLFLQDVNLVSCAVQTMSISKYKWGDYTQSFPRNVTGLHLTAGSGLLFWSERLLLELGGNFSIAADSKDGEGRTPLSDAAANGHEAIVKLLIARDDVVADSKDGEGRTPLSDAAANGHEAIVKLLIARDDVVADSKNNEGRTPLSYAAANGHEAIVKLLIARDDVLADSKDGEGRTPLSHAAATGHEAIVKLLIARDDVVADSKDDFGRTPLSDAAASGHEAIVKLLIARDDVVADSKNKYGWTPLSRAAANGHEAIVKLLIARDDVVADSKDEFGWTPLSHAAANGHEAIVKLLIARDDVVADSKDDFGRTPLSDAAASGHEAIVKLLIARDDVVADSKDKYGRTPLSDAAANGHEAIVKLLIARDDVLADSKDGDGWTPLSDAAANGHEAIVKLLIARDDVLADSKDKYGWTPLSHAAANGHEAIVKLLIARDDVLADSKDGEGRTPLSDAAANGHEAIVKLLRLEHY